MVRSRLLPVLVVGLFGCQGNDTGLLVVVDTDLRLSVEVPDGESSTPLDVERIRIVVTDPASSSPDPSEHSVNVTGRRLDEPSDVSELAVLVPFSFAVVPGGKGAGPVRIEARAESTAGEVSVHAVETRFVEGRQKLVELFISASCIEVECPGRTTCNRGRCVDPTIDSGGLEDVVPGREFRSPEGCGDGEVSGEEQCDPTAPAARGCVDFGYDRGRIRCTRSCTFDFAACDYIGWPTDLETEGAVYAIWTDDDEALVVGEAGEAHRFDGSGWSPLDPETDRDLLAVWGLSSDNLYVGGSHGVVLHFDGLEWTDISPPEWSEWFYAGWTPDGSELFAGGVCWDDATVWHRRDGEWVMTTSGPYTDLTGFWGTSRTNLWAVGYNGALRHFDGTSWAVMDFPDVGTRNITSIWGVDEDDIFITWEGEGIDHYDGATWTRQSAVGAYDIWGRSNTDIYAVGLGAAIQHYDGKGWIRHEVEGIGGLTGVGGTRNAVFAVGDGRVRRYAGAAWSKIRETGADEIWGTDRGELATVGGLNSVRVLADGQWNMLSGLGPEVLEDVWFTALDDVIVVGQAGTASRWDGAAWTEMPSMFGGEWLAAVWGSDASSLHAVANRFVTDSSLFHYDGASWRPVLLPITPGLNDVWGASASDVWAVGSTSLHYNGSSWTEISIPDGANLGSVHGVDGEVFAVGSDGLVLHNVGDGWRPMESGTNGGLSSVWAFAVHDVFAAGGETLIHYDGVAWSPVRLPESSRVTSMWGDGTTLYVTTGNSVWRLDRDRLW